MSDTPEVGKSYQFADTRDEHLKKNSKADANKANTGRVIVPLQIHVKILVKLLAIEGKGGATPFLRTRDSHYALPASSCYISFSADQKRRAGD